MERIRDTAITLKAVPYQERHQIVTALTLNHGKISAVAKNSIQSRRFGSSLQSFAAAEWDFTVKKPGEPVLLNEASLRHPYDEIHKSLNRLSLASALNETLLRLEVIEESSQELFLLHSNALSLIENLSNPAQAKTIMNLYLAKLLQWHGNQPQIQQCYQCGTTLSEIASTNRSTVARVQGWVENASWRCHQCKGPTSPTLPVTVVQDFLSALQMPIRKSFQQCIASPREHEELFEFMESLLSYHIPGFDRAPLKSLKFLN